MKKLFCLLLACALMLPIVCCQEVLAADAGSCGEDLSWSLDETGTLTISGTGDMEDFGGDDSPWAASDTVWTVIVEEGVTGISDNAFYDCYNLMEVYLADSVVSIGENAFARCIGLGTVELGSGLQSIGSYVFTECDSLTEVTLPASVNTVGQGAFEYCRSLEGIWVNENNPHFRNDENGVLFNKSKTQLHQAPGELTGTYTVPDAVTTIVSGAFYGCGKLAAVKLPGSLSQIGEYAFSDCKALKDVYYSGSETAWEAVAVGKGNSPLLEAAMHYADLLGDMDSSGKLTTDDAVYLLLHVMFGSTDYPLPAGTFTDFDRNGKTDTDDTVYLLLHVMFGSGDYPIRKG